jgi:transcriptional regulator with XRE-family HTH domain
MGEQMRTTRARDLFASIRKDNPKIQEAERKLGPKLILARNVLRLRAQRGWTQQALADHAAMRQPRIAEIESARSNTQIETLMRLSDALGVPPYALLQPFEDRVKGRGRMQEVSVGPCLKSRDVPHAWIGPDENTAQLVSMTEHFNQRGRRYEISSCPGSIDV